MKLSPEEIERLTADPTKYELPMPSLVEIDYAMWLLRKRYTIDVWFLRRRLKWLVRLMDKHYDIKWQTPWDK